MAAGVDAQQRLLEFQAQVLVQIQSASPLQRHRQKLRFGCNGFAPLLLLLAFLLTLLVGFLLQARPACPVYLVHQEERVRARYQLLQRVRIAVVRPHHQRVLLAQQRVLYPVMDGIVTVRLLDDERIPLVEVQPLEHRQRVIRRREVEREMIQAVALRLGQIAARVRLLESP